MHHAYFTWHMMEFLGRRNKFDGTYRLRWFLTDGDGMIPQIISYEVDGTTTSGYFHIGHLVAITSYRASTIMTGPSRVMPYQNYFALLESFICSIRTS